MVVRVIVQINTDGEKHVIFTQDLLSSIEDLIITRDDWINADIKESRVLMLDIGSYDILNDLVDIDFHSTLGSISCELMK